MDIDLDKLGNVAHDLQRLDEYWKGLKTYLEMLPPDFRRDLMNSMTNELDRMTRATYPIEQDQITDPDKLPFD